MEDNRLAKKKRKNIIAAIAISTIVVLLFLFIFSLYHLPERDPVETPELAVNANVDQTPLADFEETNDIMSASQEKVSEMLGDLEMQYENAKLNSEPYAAQQAGMRLAVAYWKAGQKQQAIDFVNSLIQNYSYDNTFVGKCEDLLKLFDSPKN
ncbi:MAG: hypothetical protein J1E16_08005 [Muribaculaceae bacterium]|nr:hypothetical protein [Muribaculaceae bacterium]